MRETDLRTSSRVSPDLNVRRVRRLHDDRVHHVRRLVTHPGVVAVIAENGLRDALRTLKLSGMLDTLDARLTQARAGELGHLEFLQVLCQDEIGRREQVGMARRLRRARFDGPRCWHPPSRSTRSVVAGVDHPAGAAGGRVHRDR